MYFLKIAGAIVILLVVAVVIIGWLMFLYKATFSGKYNWFGDDDEHKRPT